MSKVMRGTMLAALAAAIAAPLAQADAYGHRDKNRVNDVYRIGDVYKMNPWKSTRMNPWKSGSVRPHASATWNRIGY